MRICTFLNHIFVSGFSKKTALLPLISPFRAVNHPEFPSVLQALEIEDPVVANCLIDQRGIESILLIKVTSDPIIPE